MQEIIENGHIQGELPEFTRQYEALPVLAPRALARLRVMQAGVDGATEATQAAINVHTQRRTAYQQAFEAACEDAGITIPQGQHDVQIDWNTGDVRFIPK